MNYRSTLVKYGDNQLFLMDYPDRPYKNLQDYRKKFLGYSPSIIFDDPDIWPCIMCEGKGRIYDPSESPDVIEGYKLVGKVPCPLCKGSAVGEKIHLYIKYREQIGSWRREYKKIEEKEKELLSVLSKLSYEDIVILARYLNGFPTGIRRSLEETRIVQLEKYTPKVFV
jgi:hypothetical protein